MERPSTLPEYLIIMERLRVELARVAGYPLETILADRDKQLAAERLLQELADCALDIGRQLLVKMGEDPGTTGRLSFRQLERSGIVDREIAHRLGDYYGLRNALVHGYAAMADDEEIARLGEIEGLVNEYMAAVTAYLNRCSDANPPVDEAMPPAL
jgi:uncharacterized protein YutE (UPF0331/DUF86 family)